MQQFQTLARRAAGFLLAVLLVVPAFAAEPSETAANRQKDLDTLYHEVLEKHHPNLFAKHTEAEFLQLKAEIEERLKTVSDEEFLLDLQRLTALAGDSHTTLSIGSAAAGFRGYPFSMVRRGSSWYLSAVSPENEDLLGQEIAAMAGKPVEEIVAAFGTLFSSDNPVHLRKQFRQACNVADIYEYLGLVDAGKSLVIRLGSGKTLSLEPVDRKEMNEMEIVLLSSRVTGTPETEFAEAYYFAKPLTDSTYYIQYNTCMEADDLSMEDFAAKVSEALDAGDYSRILLDLRNNGGGSDGVIWPLFAAIRTRQLLEGDEVELVGLIGESTFSSALINAVEIQEMGGVLVGESTGGSVSHFGAVNTFALPVSGVRGQISSKYIDLNSLLDAGAGRGVVSLEPDVEITQTLEDTLAGKDSCLEWLLAHPEKLASKEYPDAPLTRGRFVGQLYASLGAPEAAITGLPFADSLGGIEWYLPAMVWAKETGIARGNAEGNFSAARYLTWREAAVFLTRAAEFLDIPSPDPSADRYGPIPAALATGWNQAAVTRAWDLGLLPADADFSGGVTRAQGEAMTAALASLAG